MNASMKVIRASVEATSIRAFASDHREFAATYLREEIVRLFESKEEKDYNAIKILYSLMLKEEEDDLTRRKVELAEREFQHQVSLGEKSAAKLDDKKPKLLPPAEIKHRVRVLLGKEAPREIGY